MLISADIPTVPWTLTGNFTLGLIGVLSVVYLILGVSSQTKKLFAKNPPVSDELSSIRVDLVRADERCQNRHNSTVALLTAERGVTDEKFRDIANDRQRSLRELHEKINEVGKNVAFIRGIISSKTK